MKKYYPHSLLTLSCFFLMVGLFAQQQSNPRILIGPGPFVWIPPPGCKTFYVQAWGGGAGGNASWASGQFGYIGLGGGGGSSFSQSTLYTVTANKQATGYAYKVGAGGALNQDGGNSYFENCFAIEGRRRGITRGKSPVGGEVALSYFGGIGGESWRNILDNRWHGGGGGSGRVNGDAAGGQTAGDGFHGFGGDGTGGGGSTGQYAAGTPGGGGSGDQSGARGEIRVFWTCDYTAGQIGNPHTVPFEPEIPFGDDIITNVSSPTGFGYTLSWQDSILGRGWQTITGAELTFKIPAIQEDTWYRRVINGCGNDANNRSNVVKIKVFSQSNGKKNGIISGKVTSVNGITGVAGITITVKKTAGLKGSLQSFPYTAVTGQNGFYTISPIFYGDNSPEGGDANSVTFTVVASLAGHKLSTSSPVILSNIAPKSEFNNFIDSTVYALTGRITQSCPTCLPQTHGIGGVKISANEFGVFDVFSADSLRADSLGYFSTTVADPKSYTFTAAYLNHQFDPATRTVLVTADVSGLNFTDTSTRLISGKLVDAAGKRIGSANLLFEGIYPRKDSAAMITFRKRAIINTNDSNYNVRLPAGKYRVSVETFTAAFPTTDPKFIVSDSVKNFFNKLAAEPLIDINFRDSVRNLVYHRPPVIVFTGLSDSLCNADPNNNLGVLFRSNVRKYFKATVFEGPEILNYRVQSSNPLLIDSANANGNRDFLRVYTSVTKIQATANADTLYYRLNNTPSLPMVDSFFVPGSPNTTAPFRKKFEVHYVDKFGRKATPIVKTATVLGVFNPTQSYITAFPEVPYLILHAPPGDKSYSYWTQNNSIETATKFSVLKDTTKDSFFNVSVGPKFSFEVGPISIEAAAIATFSTTRLHTVTKTDEEELIQKTTTTTNFTTNKSDVINGTSGDVYIGGALNYILGNSITVDFIEGAPGCKIDTASKLSMAPESFRTEFTYAEDHIVNVIIPLQQKLADQTTDAVKKAAAINQIKIWQQVIDNNTRQKKNAQFRINRSFSSGASIDESQTSNLSAVNTITYDVTTGSNLASELGLAVGGLGVSGGAVITMRQTTGEATVTNKTKETTMGYHLEENDPGDYYSVDIKKDPVYGTPVFALVAGTSSCPPEEGAQNRDMPQIASGDQIFNDLKTDSIFNFVINLTNKSESGEARFYNLSVDGTTGEGLVVSSSSSSNLRSVPAPYFLAFGQSLNVAIKVEKFIKSDKILSYPKVEFYFSDACTVDNVFVPNTTSTAKITFNYASTSGSIRLAAPAEGWVVNATTPNILPITIAGYQLNDIDSVTLEYEKINSKIWNPGFTLKRADITNPTSFTRNWDMSALRDTIYNLRLKLVCQNRDVILSNIVTGAKDKFAPSLVGAPQPINKLYKQADGEISFSYNENIFEGNLNSGAVELLRRSTNTLVPVIVNELNGKLSITPVNSLGTVADSFRVIVKNIADIYGNVKIKADTSLFKLDLSQQIVDTSTNGATVYFTPSSILNNSTGSMELRFKLRRNTTKITRVYFNLSGTALLDQDFRIRYDTIRQRTCINGACIILPVYNKFLGSPGYVNIDSNKMEAIIYISPVENPLSSGDKSIKINLITGADYRLQDSIQTTGTILYAAPACPPGNILYVNENATGNNSGVSWQNAMTSLKNALNRNCPGVTQIWVAKGIYKPTSNTNRDSSFTLKNNIAIYGGFAGTETLLSQRNWRTNPTILSGDIGIVSNYSDNSYNVIRNENNGLNNTAVLNGFTITGGNANKGDYTGNRGGGVHNSNSAPTFYNCIISGNNAQEYGGGMFNEASAPSVANCIFSSNTALYGGGLYNESAATKTINCSFSGNQVVVTGGAVYTYGAVTPQITNSILWGNSSGIQNAGGATPAVTYSIVQGGYAGVGNLNTDPFFIMQPAVGLASAADLRLQGCSPAMNVASTAALPAGLASDLAALPRIVNSIIDMGAYERQTPASSTTLYVDVAATGNNSGETWANAYTSFNSALNELNYCAPGTTILIAAGLYTAPINSTFDFNKLNVTILGGYPNGGGTRNSLLYKVFLKGNVRALKSLQMDGITVQKP